VVALVEHCALLTPVVGTPVEILRYAQDDGAEKHRKGVLVDARLDPGLNP